MSTVPDEAPATVETHRKPPFLRRVRIRNFKSIKFCDVTLEPLTVLVGRNGSGKSNFVEALAFLRDAVTWGVEKAVNLHGGMTVRHGLVHEPVCIDVEYQTSPRWAVDSPPTPFRYVLEVIGVQDRPQIARESRQNLLTMGFDINQRYESKTHRTHTAWLSYEGDANPLRTIQEYNFVPEEMRRPQRDISFTLSRSGMNIANVLNMTRMAPDDGWAYRRIQHYMSNVVNEVRSVEPVQIGDYETVIFHLKGSRSEELSLNASSMSDGTLRAIATLVAAYQDEAMNGSPSLVAIEEPETSLHPAAMHALVGALDEATGRTQILLTTHSTELLDNPTIRPENVRVVEMVNGETIITPVDDASVQIVKEGLNTLGGLEREDRLQLNRKTLREREKAAESPQ